MAVSCVYLSILAHIADFSTRRHVFADLRPYLCTFPDCEDSARSYRTRMRFVMHELKVHRGHWICHCPSAGCHETFQDSETQLQHVKTHELGPSILLPEMILNPVQRSDCLICGERIETGRVHLARHVGRHMEEISFAVVTKTYEEWASYADTSHGESLGSRSVASVRNGATQKSTG